MSERIECVVVGAGVVGLAVARALALAGREVMVLESDVMIGTGTSSRNSEVIHAGIYYPPGSQKAHAPDEQNGRRPLSRWGQFSVAVASSAPGSNAAATNACSRRP